MAPASQNSPCQLGQQAPTLGDGQGGGRVGGSAQPAPKQLPSRPLLHQHREPLLPGTCAHQHILSRVNPGLITAAFSLATHLENLTCLPGSASSQSLHAPWRCPGEHGVQRLRPRLYLYPINAANFVFSYSNLLHFKRKAYLREHRVGVTAAETRHCHARATGLSAARSHPTPAAG